MTPLSERSEELLESLWMAIVEEGESACDVTVLSDDAALQELVNGGLVRITERKAALTSKGHDAAAGCVRRHRLAERLMADVLDMRKPLVHEPSCAFEHLLHEGLDESICTLLGHPRTCPHGSRIPEGRCCREARSQVGKVIVPLTELKPGEKGTISYLHTHNRDSLQKLIAIGALPKTQLVLLQRVPTPVLEIGRSRFAIDEELASHVHVRRA